VLNEVRRLAAQGRVRFTFHSGVERAARFGHDKDNVVHALKNGRSIRKSAADQASDWVVSGSDLDGDDLDVAIVIEDAVVVITVF
jgi:hypothetical protein